MRLLFVLQLIIFIISPIKLQAADSPIWTYDGDYTGQDDWGALPGYEICREGFSQSPVNIGYTKSAKLAAPDFKYHESNVTVSHTQKTLIASFIDGGSVAVSGKNYNLRSIELHSPSGHKVNGASYPLEIHMIHEDDKGNLLIVAIFARIENENIPLGDILQAAGRIGAIKFNAQSLIPEADSYYSYKGSLPYPPCTENVQWRIFKNPITISRKQLSEIGKYIGRNTRLTQPLYMREVLETNQ